jgi:UTP:GlnB (protein PII) uridylyltransferase
LQILADILFSAEFIFLTLCFVQVDSANKYGTLLEVVQVLTDLKLTIKRAYISSDGEWFMDGERLCLQHPCLGKIKEEASVAFCFRVWV